MSGMIKVVVEGASGAVEEGSLAVLPQQAPGDDPGVFENAQHSLSLTHLSPDDEEEEEEKAADMKQKKKKKKKKKAKVKKKRKKSKPRPPWQPRSRPIRDTIERRRRRNLEKFRQQRVEHNNTGENSSSSSSDVDATGHSHDSSRQAVKVDRGVGGDNFGGLSSPTGGSFVSSPLSAKLTAVARRREARLRKEKAVRLGLLSPDRGTTCSVNREEEAHEMANEKEAVAVDNLEQVGPQCFLVFHSCKAASLIALEKQAGSEDNSNSISSSGSSYAEADAQLLFVSMAGKVLGGTEVAGRTLNPMWDGSVKVEYAPETGQRLRLVVVDRSNGKSSSEENDQKDEETQPAAAAAAAASPSSPTAIPLDFEESQVLGMCVMALDEAAACVPDALEDDSDEEEEDDEEMWLPLTGTPADSKERKGKLFSVGSHLLVSVKLETTGLEFASGDNGSQNGDGNSAEKNLGKRKKIIPAANPLPEMDRGLALPPWATAAEKRKLRREISRRRRKVLRAEKKEQKRKDRARRAAVAKEAMERAYALQLERQAKRDQFEHAVMRMDARRKMLVLDRKKKEKMASPKRDPKPVSQLYSLGSSRSPESFAQEAPTDALKPPVSEQVERSVRLAKARARKVRQKKSSPMPMGKIRKWPIKGATRVPTNDLRPSSRGRSRSGRSKSRNVDGDQRASLASSSAPVAAAVAAPTAAAAEASAASFDQELRAARLLRVSVSVRSLVSRDRFSKSDPMVVVFEHRPRQQDWQIVSRTEWRSNCHDPDFKTPIDIVVPNEHGTDGEDPIMLRFDVFDVDSETLRFEDLVCSASISAEELIECVGEDVCLKLQHPGQAPKSLLNKTLRKAGSQLVLKPHVHDSMDFVSKAMLASTMLAAHSAAGSRLDNNIVLTHLKFELEPEELEPPASPEVENVPDKISAAVELEPDSKEDIVNTDVVSDNSPSAHQAESSGAPLPSAPQPVAAIVADESVDSKDVSEDVVVEKAVPSPESESLAPMEPAIDSATLSSSSVISETATEIDQVVISDQETVVDDDPLPSLDEQNAPAAVVHDVVEPEEVSTESPMPAVENPPPEIDLLSFLNSDASQDPLQIEVAASAAAQADAASIQTPEGLQFQAVETPVNDAAAPVTPVNSSSPVLESQIASEELPQEMDLLSFLNSGAPSNPIGLEVCRPEMNDPLASAESSNAGNGIVPDLSLVVEPAESESPKANGLDLFFSDLSSSEPVDKEKNAAMDNLEFLLATPVQDGLSSTDVSFNNDESQIPSYDEGAIASLPVSVAASASASTSPPSDTDEMQAATSSAISLQTPSASKSAGTLETAAAINGRPPRTNAKDFNSRFKSTTVVRGGRRKKKIQSAE